MSIMDIARDAIRVMKPYRAAVRVDDTIRLNANEAPWSTGGGNYHRPLNRYPEIRPARLASLLAQRYDCSPGNLLVTRGSSEGIDLLVRAFCEAGRDNLVTTNPTFSMYRHYAVLQGVELRQVDTPAENDFAVDADAILNACDASTKLIILCSPNNPTGTLVSRDTLRTILTSRAGRSAVVVDEAYIEFADQASALDLCGEFDNLIVLRTLSKALAFAGARCGSVIAAAEVIDMLDAVQTPYALATPVVECVESALQSATATEAERQVSSIVDERERLHDELAKYPFVRRVWPSSANFLLVDVDDAQGLMNQCAEDKILLRHFGGALQDCVRITIGTPDENRRLLESLARLEARNA